MQTMDLNTTQGTNQVPLEEVFSQMNEAFKTHGDVILLTDNGTAGIITPLYSVEKK